MSELLVNTIKKADGTGSLTVPAESGTVVTTASPSLGRRNLIINGAMQVWQRGTSANGGSISNFVWTADRFWLYGPSTTSGTVGQSTDVPSNQGFTYSMYNNCDASCNVGTNVELLKTGDAGIFYSGQVLTLSFWVKGASASTVSNVNYSFRDNSGGTGSVTAATSGSFDVTTEWNRVELPITITGSPTVNNKMFQFEFGMPVGAKFTGFQLEVGSVATPFEHRSYGEELALCQRYYYDPNAGSSGSLDGNSILVEAFTTGCVAAFQFPVTMRADPTVSIFGSKNSNAGQIRTTRSGAYVGSSAVATNVGNNGFSFVSGVSGLTTGERYDCTYKADAEL